MALLDSTFAGVDIADISGAAVIHSAINFAVVLPAIPQQMILIQLSKP